MNMLSVTQIQVEGFDKNFSYLIVDEESKKCVLVDPCGEIERVFEEIKKRELDLIAVFITHSHFDHHEKLDVSLDFSPTPVYMHEKAKGRTVATSNDERLLSHNDVVKVGEGNVTTFYTPGHHDDCMCYYVPEKEAHDSIPKVLTGDTLFVEGCGRTTEAGVEDLYKSLLFLAELPDETEVFTGHDYGSTPTSTIEREKKNNKYYLTKDFEEFKKIRLG